MSGLKIPHFGLTRQYTNLKDELLSATDNALKDGILINGPYTKKFENWLQNYTGTKYAVTVHSGTQALEIIARYKKIVHKKNMEGNPKIRLPNLTYPATLNAFVTAGWDIELSDTDKYGILKFGNNTAGVYECLVGLYGLKPWHHAKIENSFGVIVDGAQHWLVAEHQIGTAMAISFDPTKNLNCSGNGGAIVTNDHHLYLYASRYKDNNKPDFYEAGTNSKMSELDCSHLLVKTKYITEWQSRRKQISKYWCDEFKDYDLLCLNDTPDPHAHQKFVIYYRDRNKLNEYLKSNGIETKISYEYVLGDLPHTSHLFKPDLISKSVMLSKGVLSLPIFPELTDIEIEYIADIVKKYFVK